MVGDFLKKRSMNKKTSPGFGPHPILFEIFPKRHRFFMYINPEYPKSDRLFDLPCSSHCGTAIVVHILGADMHILHEVAPVACGEALSSKTSRCLVFSCGVYMICVTALQETFCRSDNTNSLAHMDVQVPKKLVHPLFACQRRRTISQTFRRSSFFAWGKRSAESGRRRKQEAGRQR
jgi:hypothetical protein